MFVRQTFHTPSRRHPEGRRPVVKVPGVPRRSVDPRRKLCGNRRVALDVIPLSVLDLATVATGSTPAQALRETVEISSEVERLGYHRMWVAEHHGMPAVASSAPAVLIAHLADATTTLRVGSGGVMLPNHAPLVIAEQFGTLEALHPGRIDLGLGRAPGTDQVTVPGPSAHAGHARGHVSR